MSAVLLCGTVVADPATRQVEPDGAVLVDGGRILAVGRRADLAGAGTPLTGRDERLLVLPGLVDAHTHVTGVSPLQRGVADDDLEPWLTRLLALPPCDVSLDVRWAAARAARQGITTVVGSTDAFGAPDVVRRAVTQAAAAFAEVGIRARLLITLLDDGRFAAEGDARFLARLPGALRDEVTGRWGAAAPSTLPDGLSIAAAGTDAARVALGLGPAGPGWVRPSGWAQIAEAAAADPTQVVQTHLAESLAERSHGPRHWGAPTLDVLAGTGVLGPRTSAAHAVHLDDHDRAVLADHQVTVVHCPSSNLRLRCGIADVPALRTQGVPLALGTDDHALDDDGSLLRELRLARYLHGRHGRPEAPDAWEVLAMATTGGAQVAGLPGRGRLEAGAPADLVAFDLDALAGGRALTGALDPVELFVARATERQVRWVLVDGEPVLADGRLVHVDADAAQDAAVAAARPVDPELERVVAALLPHVREALADVPLAPVGATR